MLFAVHNNDNSEIEFRLSRKWHEVYNLLLHKYNLSMMKYKYNN